MQFSRQHVCAVNGNTFRLRSVRLRHKTYSDAHRFSPSKALSSWKQQHCWHHRRTWPSTSTAGCLEWLMQQR